MFKVFRNGIHHSSHTNYADACRLARMQAARDRQAYYTVHETQGDGAGKPLYKADAMQGFPAYIVQPMTPRAAMLETSTGTSYTQPGHRC